MANTAGEADFDRAKAMRARKKGLGAKAGKALDEAADRLEARGIKKVSRVGRKAKKPQEVMEAY